MIQQNKFTSHTFKNPKPPGYASGFQAHLDPINTQQPPPVITQKQDKTLIGLCLKGFIKERLYGDFINYAKKNKTRSQIQMQRYGSIAGSTSRASIMKSRIQLPSLRQSKKLQQQNSRSHNRYSSLSKNPQQQPQNPNLPKQKLESYLNNRLSSNISKQKPYLPPSTTRKSLNDQKSNNRSSRLSKNNTQLKSINKSIMLTKYEGQPHSFISSIEDHQFHDVQMQKNQNSRRDRKGSVAINNASKKVTGNGPPTKSAFFKKQIDKYVVNPQIWQLFCLKPSISKIASNLAFPRLQTEISQPQNTLPLITNNLSFKKIVTIQKSILKLSSAINKKFLQKQQFQTYINNNTQVIPSLTTHIISFFELVNKINDQIKSQEYKKHLNIIIQASHRVWSVCAFRFFDLDRNGVICSKDIFRMFKVVDQLEQNNQGQTQQECKLRRYCQTIKQILEELRTSIISNKLDLHPKDPNEIKYLEQSMLKNKDLKYSDLVLILGDNIKKKDKQASKDIIENIKDHQIKFSSCYKYSYLATDHNQATRMNREKIQHLKENLKNEKIETKKSQAQNMLERGTLKGIEYDQFHQNKYYNNLKAISLEMLGLQFIH